MRRKFLVTLHNEEIFFKSEVKYEERTKKQSKLTWNVLTPQMRQDYYNYVVITDLYLRDRVLSLGLGDLYKERIFSIIEAKVRPYDFNDDIQVAVTYEFSPDLLQLKRKVYSIMDWLGDIGGLKVSLFVIFSTIVLIF